jgi:hypothetical protein
VARVPEPGRGLAAHIDQQAVLNAICIIVASVVRASLPASGFTLAWEHSVEKSRWEEHYESDGERLKLTQARIQGFGAGMEAPSNARLVDGWWTWHPTLAPLPALRLTHSDYTRDYRVCWNARCATLAVLTGPMAEGEVVTVAPCAKPRS